MRTARTSAQADPAGPTREVTPGSWSRTADRGQDRWRVITGAHLVAPARAGARFENGVLVEHEEATLPETA